MEAGCLWRHQAIYSPGKSTDETALVDAPTGASEASVGVSAGVGRSDRVVAPAPQEQSFDKPSHRPTTSDAPTLQVQLVPAGCFPSFGQAPSRHVSALSHGPATSRHTTLEEPTDRHPPLMHCHSSRFGTQMVAGQSFGRSHDCEQAPTSSKATKTVDMGLNVSAQL